MGPGKRPKRGRRRPEMALAGTGFDLAASVGVGTLIGWWIDRQYETEPWGLIICALLGIIGGLYNFIRVATSVTRESSEESGGG